jgi:hypothetical protein
VDPSKKKVTPEVEPVVIPRRKISLEEIEKEFLNITPESFFMDAWTVAYCTKIKGPCQVEFARRNYRVSEYVYTYNYHLTGLPKQEHDEEIDCWGVLYKKHETQYDYENKKLIDRSHLDETSVYRYKRTRHENNKWNVFTRLEKLN